MLLELLVQQAQLAQQVRKVFRVSQVRQVRQEPRVFRDCLVLRERQGLKVLLARQELTERR